MGVAYFIVVEGEPDFDWQVNGKPVARASEQLRRLAEQLGVPPLEDFFSGHPLADGAPADILEGIYEDDELAAHPKVWHASEDGLRTVRALLASIQATPGCGSELRDAAEDLQGFEQVLEEAARRGLRWHLSMDL